MIEPVVWVVSLLFFFFQAEDGIRDLTVTGVQTCALPILVGGLEALQRGGNGGVDVVDGLAHALAQVTGLVAVTQLDRFLGAGRGAGGNRGTTERTVLQDDFGFQRGVATAVEDFTGVDAADRTHGRAGYLSGEGATKRMPRDYPRLPATCQMAQAASAPAGPDHDQDHRYQHHQQCTGNRRQDGAT